MTFACDIDTKATFGPGLYLPHPIGIVIGGGVKVGANVSISQNVTLGRSRHEVEQSVLIGDDVEIWTGAVVVGNLAIGNGVKIGANSVVLTSVPSNTIAVGAPARVIRRTTSGAADEA